jgi:hypothetical protein
VRLGRHLQPGRGASAISPRSGKQHLVKDNPVALRISGNTVLNIGCPALRLREQACSAGRPPQLRVNQKLPWRSAVIVVQFDLPRPQPIGVDHRASSLPTGQTQLAFAKDLGKR